MVPPCAEITPNVIYCYHRVNNKCYEDLPTETVGQNLFASTHTRLLRTTSLEINCYTRPHSVYMGNIVWTDGEHEMFVQEIKRNLDFKTYQSRIASTSGAFQDPEVEKAKKKRDQILSLANSMERATTGYKTSPTRTVEYNAKT